MNAYPFVPLPHRPDRTPEEIQRRARGFFDAMRTRRTVRQFANRPLPDGVIEDCLRTAGTAPSGANLQPWQFVVVRSPKVKRQIRQAAEEEERHFYEHRAPAEWLEVLRPLGTDAEKPFLETAPALVAVFGRRWSTTDDGRRVKHYYVDESVGLATGLLVAAIHHAGLVCLTHTPSPVKFMNEVLERPEEERAFLLLVVGYPADDAVVPDIGRKRLDEIVTFVD